MAYVLDQKSIREQLPLYMRDWLIDSYSYIWYHIDETPMIPDNAVLILSSMPDTGIEVYQCLEQNSTYTTPIKSLDVVFSSNELTNNPNAVYYDVKNAVIQLGDGTDGFKPAFQQPLIVVYKPKEYGVRVPYLINVNANETLYFYKYNIPDASKSIFIKTGSKTDGYYRTLYASNYPDETRDVQADVLLYENNFSYIYMRCNISADKIMLLDCSVFNNGTTTHPAWSVEITPSPYSCEGKGGVEVYDWELYYSLSGSNLIPASSSIYPFGSTDGLILNDTMTIDAQIYASYEDTGNTAYMDTYFYTAKDFKTSYLTYNPTYVVIQSAGYVNTGTKKEGFTSPMTVNVPFESVIVRCLNNDTAKKVTAVKIYMRKK